MADAREAFDQLTDAINRHDVKAAGACYSADVVTVTPDGKVQGREQAAAFLGQFLEAFPDLRIDSWAKITSGDVVADEWTMTGTHTGPLATPEGDTIPATGRSVTMRGIDVGVVEDGLITSHRIYYDQLEFMTQLGLLNQPETVA